ncbi:hypothetical protein FACS18949_10920 [Clostridia bacterium]|nr:hypothetical protein FACS18949_10920 [Clostridia bacterium]
MYKATAVTEGAGGFIAGFADFPALLTIEMKFLFECAAMYGFDVNDESERMYILHVFQLAFSNREHRQDCFKRLENWRNSDETMDVENQRHERVSNAKTQRYSKVMTTNSGWLKIRGTAVDSRANPLLTINSEPPK